MAKLHKFSWLVLAILLGTSCNFSSQEETPESSMLWKIERDDLEHPTYMLGTMHLINKEFFHFPDKLQKLIKNSKQLIMELEGLPNPAEAAELMRLPDSVKLADFFSEEQLAFLYDFAQEDMKMTPEMFDMTFGRMKPFVLLQLITQRQFEGETESFELTLMDLAKKNDIQAIGLETIKQQIGFFDAIPMDGMANIITSYFENTDSLKEQTRILQQIYRKGNLDTLAHHMLESSPELMEFEEILLSGRNKRWMPQILELIFQKPSFIAVGAAHLAGENGLVELLRKEGFTVTPVAF